MRWRNIVTDPPTDDAAIMVCNADWYGAATRWTDGNYHIWYSFFEPWKRTEERLTNRPNCITATHWMPLLSPPA